MRHARIDTCMSGIVVPICQYAVYNHSFLAPGASEEVILADRVPAAPFAKIGGSLRVHRRNISSGGLYQIIIRGINPSKDDGVDFVWATDLGSTLATTGTSNPTTVPGLMQLSTIISDLQHPMVRVVLKATGPTATGSLYIVVSFDLIMRMSG